MLVVQAFLPSDTLLPEQSLPVVSVCEWPSSYGAAGPYLTFLFRLFGASPNR